ncbi:MAG: N-acetylmuramoyl-L-alanine amidase [Anaerolineaceae bacterium]|nr:N-acetylmuramoyl-L-alanine amidase [Anaerolineaceae bacterium]
MSDNTIPEPPTPLPPNPPPSVRRSSVRRFSVFNSIQTVIGVSIMIASLFTLWTPANLFSNQLIEQMLAQLQNNPQQAGRIFPTPTNSLNPRIGIVSGHWGNDSGFVCKDGTTEQQVNLRIATLVKQNLQNAGYQVDLMQEFDKQLNQYQAQALVSIHNDTCDYINGDATGFKIAAARSNANSIKSAHLIACLAQRYGSATGLHYHPNSTTKDMTTYHTFDEISSDTTAAVIEAGYLNLDRQMLTQKTDVVAKGISDGILCFVRNEQIPQGEIPTP